MRVATSNQSENVTSANLRLPLSNARLHLSGGRRPYLGPSARLPDDGRCRFARRDCVVGVLVNENLGDGAIEKHHQLPRQTVRTLDSFRMHKMG